MQDCEEYIEFCINNERIQAPVNGRTGKIRLVKNIPQILVEVAKDGSEVWMSLYEFWSQNLNIQCPHCDEVFKLNSVLKAPDPGEGL